MRTDGFGWCLLGSDETLAFGIGFDGGYVESCSAAPLYVLCDYVERKC